MRWFVNTRLVLLAGLSLTLPAWASPASAAEDALSDRVSFSACDGVELSGTFYPGPKGKKDKDAVVLLLHDFDPRKGGGSHGDWDKLAEKLQKEGYSVLSFDFRGFGGSKSVREDFWKFDYNRRGIPKAYHGGNKSAESIDQKDFQLSYYPALINDIAAARAYLDRRNDAREVNTSNLIVIGAGEGATLGALWMAAEMHRQKDTTPPMVFPQAFPQRMDDPEGKDFAAAVWLTISPKVAERSVTQAVKSSLVELARDNKIPLAFYFGKNDTSGATLAKNYLDAIGSGKKLDKNTGSKAIPGTELSGSKLLGGRLSTVDYIADYLNRVVEDRGSKEWKKREEEKSRYFWTVNGRPKRPAKNVGEKVVGPIPAEMMKLGPR